VFFFVIDGLSETRRLRARGLRHAGAAVLGMLTLGIGRLGTMLRHRRLAPEAPDPKSPNSEP
jgi:hypothetical protein